MAIKKKKRILTDGSQRAYYQAVVCLPNRKQVSKNFDRKIDAEAWERNKRTQQDKGVPSSQETVAFGRFASEWLEKYSKPRKAFSSNRRDEQLLRLQILPYFSKAKLDSISMLMVETWMQNLKDSYSPKTCNHSLGLLKKILGDAHRYGVITSNPASFVRPFKVQANEISFWSRAEISTFLTNIRYGEEDKYVLFMLALNTGMRRGEIRALKWDSVDFGLNQITVRESWCQWSKVLKSTKSGKVRRIPINKELKQILMAHKLKSTNEFVFDGHKLFNTTPVMKRICKQAGVKPIRFHDLRHTFASHFMMSGGKIYDLQKILGHSTIQMTERYSHLSPEHLNGKTEHLNFSATEKMADVISINS